MKYSLVNSSTFFTNVIIQQPKQASSRLSLQEKIKRDLKKGATPGGSSSNKSVRSCPSPPPSSESSCSAVTKDDCGSVDDRSATGSEFMLCIRAMCSASVHHLISSFLGFFRLLDPDPETPSEASAAQLPPQPPPSPSPECLPSKQPATRKTQSKKYGSGSLFTLLMFVFSSLTKKYFTTPAVFLLWKKIHRKSSYTSFI